MAVQLVSPEAKMLGSRCNREELQDYACSVSLKDENTFWILFLQQFSPALSSTMEHQTPHGQRNTKIFTCFAQLRDWFQASRLWFVHKT